MNPIQFGSFQVIKGTARQINDCLPKLGQGKIGYAPFANVEGKANAQYWLIAQGSKDVAAFGAHKPANPSLDPTVPIDPAWASWAESQVPRYWQNGRHQLAEDILSS